MPRLTLAAAVAAAALVLPAAASADPVDYAIIGDTPYGASMITAFPSQIAQINADPTVQRVVHLGDIKNGSSRCDTSYFEQIRSDFDLFEDPLVYTPGDNEWTDCHRANNGGYQPAGPVVAGAPVVTAGPSRLDEVRRIFFDRPGWTLGRNAVRVQAQRGLPENVRWRQAGTVFSVLDVPGSDNDGLPWFGDAETPALRRVRLHERFTRTVQDLIWLHQTFAKARRSGARAVVVGIQADMWDPEITGDPSGYEGFTPIVQLLAFEARHFEGEVLLLNGDSHVYEADRPLADASASNNTIYGVPAVPNLQRITVDGSNNANDYLRLTIDPARPEVFSFTRVPFLTVP